MSERDWTIVHIRDDLGAIHNLIVLANGLLAGILGALRFASAVRVEPPPPLV